MWPFPNWKRRLTHEVRELRINLNERMNFMATEITDLTAALGILGTKVQALIDKPSGPSAEEKAALVTAKQQVDAISAAIDAKLSS